MASELELISMKFDDSAYLISGGPSELGLLGGQHFGEVVEFREEVSGLIIDGTIYGVVQLKPNKWRICGAVARCDLSKGRKAQYFAEVNTKTRHGKFQFAN